MADESKSEAIPTQHLDELLADQVAGDLDEIGDTATASAIQAAAGTVDELLYSKAFGARHLEDANPPSVTTSTPFDIASLTKPMVGSVLSMQAVDEGLLDWETPVDEIVPEWRTHPDKAARDTTFLQLLNHTSGLPDWHPFFDDHPVDPDKTGAERAFGAIVDTIARTPLEAPPGDRHAYSDLGYLLITRALETLFDETIDELARTRIFEPLNLERTDYASRRRQIQPVDDAVATERCPHRKRLIRGTVHDTNTNVIGGVSTHAGVFSTAEEVLAFGQHLLSVDREDTEASPVIPRPQLRFCWSSRSGSEAGHHLAGWDTPSGDQSSAGRGCDPDLTVGHLGFTGTSLWIERRRGIVAVLLTNRVYPTRENDRIRPLRIAFQETILPPP